MSLFGGWAVMCVKCLTTDVHSDMGLFVSKRFCWMLQFHFPLRKLNGKSKLKKRFFFLQSLPEWKRRRGVDSVQEIYLEHYTNQDVFPFPVGCRLSFSFQHAGSKIGLAYDWIRVQTLISLMEKAINIIRMLSNICQRPILSHLPPICIASTISIIIFNGVWIASM